MPRDSRTRHQGVFARHQKRCQLEQGGKRCTCKPSYWGKVYDRAQQRPIRTRRFATAEAARNARADLQARLDRGSGLAERARERWAAAALRPITLQECRHSAATWLDAAGVSPKVASVLMGHSTPQRQTGAAQITLERYTHALPEDIERAREQLTHYLAGAQAERAAQ